jgi:DNA-binding response OmpR family regulator
MAGATLRDSTSGTSWRLDVDHTVLGRDEDCQIVVPAQAVSRRHAALQRTKHGWSIVDLNSSNGTFVNGERVSEQGRPLRDGDEVVLAGKVALRFVDPQATPMAPAIGRLVGVWINPDTSEVWVDAQLVEPPLSDRQQLLIELLYHHEDVVVSRERVIEHVWSDVAADGVSAEAIDALVKRVRSRIRPLQLHGDWLQVVRGRGLRLNAPEVVSS